MLIPPDLRARLRGLRFVSPLIANGSGVGQHSGRHRGAGLEFEQYRAYEPGDEPRRVDWKLYGRSDRFFVREAARDSPLTVWVLVDATASMAQADAARPHYSKFAAAKLLAACLSEIAVTQGEPIGLIALSAAGVQLVPPGTGTRHHDRLLVALDRLTCTGAWPGESTLAPVWERIALDSLVVILSDGFDPALPSMVGRLAAARRQVLSLGLVSCEERDFPFAGGFIFRDPETGEECRVDGEAARNDFLRRFAHARAELMQRLAQSGVRHVEHVLDEPPDLALRRLLSAGAIARAPTDASGRSAR
jgi:uncharacterized protein (DUF58 family)